MGEKADIRRGYTVSWVLFGFSGRIGRQSYILGQLFMLMLLAAVIARIVAVEGKEGSTVFWGLVFLGLGAISVLSMVAMAAKRLHDLGLPGLLAIFILVPAIGVAMVILLALLASSPRINAYGPPPFPPSNGNPASSHFGR